MTPVPPAAFLDVRVIWDDRTPYGLALSGRLAQTMRERLHPRATALLATERMRPPQARRLVPIAEAVDVVRAERRLLRHRHVIEDDQFWRPDAALCSPGAVVLMSDAGCEEITFAADTATLASIRTTLCGGEAAAPLATVLERIAERDEVAAEASFSDPLAPTLVGHACVTLSDGDVRLWTDPFLRPKSIRYAPGRQPISPLDAPEHRHVVLITHSHPDHFDPASLLRFPQDTVVIVPAVEAETPLTIDMGLRARQLGFTDVRLLHWGDAARVGGFEIRAFPFYGEQPLGWGAVAERPDRNVGSFYHVAEPNGRTSLFLADAGADPACSAPVWSRTIRSAVGAPDLLFANHRTWRLYPPHYLVTSVAHFLAYVPDAELDRVQQIMLTNEELSTIAATLGVKRVIPYAMGGAPWFAELGLGFEHASEAPPSAFDARPGDVPLDQDALIAPAFSKCVLDPGDGIDAQLARSAQATPILECAARRAALQPLAVAYGGADARTLNALLQAIRAVPSAILIASPTFAEVIHEEAVDEFAPALIAACDAVAVCAWRATTRRPLTFAAFGASTPWRRYFMNLHRKAIAALADGRDAAAAMAETLAQSPTAPVGAVVAITHDLLGFRPAIAPRPSRDAPDELAVHTPTLPSQAQMLTHEYGSLAVALALAHVKATHNTFVTGALAGRLDDVDEQAWFAKVFAH